MLILITKDNNNKRKKTLDINYTLSPPTNEELVYWLALWRAPEIGAIRFMQLHQQFPKLSDLFSLSQHELNALQLNTQLIAYLTKPDWSLIEKDILWINQSGNSVMTYLDEDFPVLLKEIKSTPPLLFIRGNRHSLATPQLAIVGSRHPSVIGIENAGRFAKHLGNHGLTITSGLALGIDAASHRGALATRSHTIAVMGTGLDSIYPKQHRYLAEEIAQQGALVSEFPCGTTAMAKHFPRRNRIISGLSLGVLVVEAAQNSGSLITAHTANDQGREVFAMPGSIHNPLSRGCHVLLRQGAKLVENANDILEELGPLLVASANPPTDPLQGGETCIADSKPRNSLPRGEQALGDLSLNFKKIIDSIDFAATPIDLIVSRSGLTASAVSSMLLHLELQELVCAVPGGYVRLPQ